MMWLRGLCIILAIVASVFVFRSALYIGRATGLTGYVAERLHQYRSPDPGYHRYRSRRFAQTPSLAHDD